VEAIQFETCQTLNIYISFGQNLNIDASCCESLTSSDTSKIHQ
jgi:hypothetical protein